MATDNDVYLLTHEYTVLGQICNNVYTYQRGTGVGADAVNLVEEWIEQVLPSIRAIQANETITTAVRARNLFDVTDTAEDLLSLAGTAGAAGTGALPSFVAAGFILERENASTKNGAKRVGGMREAASGNNVWTDSSFLTLLGNAATDMAETLLGALSAEWFFPVITGRILDGGSYRLPETAAEAVINAIVDVIFDLDVTTQNSRKSWVGV